MKVRELIRKAVDEIHKEKVELAINKMKSLIRKREALQKALNDLDKEISVLEEMDVEDVEVGYTY
jgi:uncharacterized coiled-coil DUF342 family protein